MHPESETDEADDADETEDRAYHQAPGAPQDKPEQGPKDLATIEGIDGENVEKQQADIDIKDPVNQCPQVGDGRVPTQQKAHAPDRHDDWSQGDVYQRSGGDAPEGSAGALRGIHKGDAA
jgi:hypothetical protein